MLQPQPSRTQNRRKQAAILGMGLTLGLTLGLPPLVAEAVPQQFEVGNMAELLQAVASHRTIRLKPGIYRMSPEFKTNAFVHWKNGSPTLILKGVSDLHLIGSGLGQTLLVNDRCSAPFLGFEQSSAVRLQGIGFGRMSQGHDQPLDCSMGLRGREHLVPDHSEQQAKIGQWRQVAQAIAAHKTEGIELPEYTEALYPQVLEQVQDQSRPLSPEEDALAVRQESMRPRLGLDYAFAPQEIVDRAGRSAQVATLVFDRSHNLLTALDAQARVILALEAHNNTRWSWSRSPQWLMQHAMVPESNAPAPNGIYAMGRILKDNPNAGESFGSYRMLIQGGMPARRQILFHSRDHRQSSEIPWTQDQNDANSRTLGCFLLQDPDLVQLAHLVGQSAQPPALVIQGAYAKNLASPELDSEL